MFFFCPFILTNVFSFCFIPSCVLVALSPCLGLNDFKRRRRRKMENTLCREKVTLNKMVTFFFIPNLKLSTSWKNLQLLSLDACLLMTVCLRLTASHCYSPPNNQVTYFSLRVSRSLDQASSNDLISVQSRYTDGVES